MSFLPLLANRYTTITTTLLLSTTEWAPSSVSIPLLLAKKTIIIPKTTTTTTTTTIATSPSHSITAGTAAASFSFAPTRRRTFVRIPHRSRFSSIPFAKTTGMPVTRWNSTMASNKDGVTATATATTTTATATSTTIPTRQRRSKRLLALRATSFTDTPKDEMEEDKKKKTNNTNNNKNKSNNSNNKDTFSKEEAVIQTSGKRRQTSNNIHTQNMNMNTNTKRTKDIPNVKKTITTSLARIREMELLHKNTDSSFSPNDNHNHNNKNNNNNNKNIIQYVIGVDEAGRGPLAGPVVAAAIHIPTTLDGITDSKKLTSEDLRSELYRNILTSPNLRYAIAVMDSHCIDQVNILQATLMGMRWAVKALISMDNGHGHGRGDGDGWDDEEIVVKSSIDSSIQGCYVVRGHNDAHGRPVSLPTTPTATTNDTSGKGSIDSILLQKEQCHALIDGNKLPKHMPCDAETMIKGDSREYSIAAASILAKVARDTLMHQYHELYPHYNLAKHKGYPTKAHMEAVFRYGASPIHRRTFAPLKHMVFDEHGNILDKQVK